MEFCLQGNIRPYTIFSLIRVASLLAQNAKENIERSENINLHFLQCERVQQDHETARECHHKWSQGF